MNFHLLENKASRIPIAIVLCLVSIMALYHLSLAIIDYRVEMMDLNAPTINTKPSPIPRPYARRPQFDASPAQRSAPGTVCMDECLQRTTVFI